MKKSILYCSILFSVLLFSCLFDKTETQVQAGADDKSLANVTTRYWIWLKDIPEFDSVVVDLSVDQTSISHTSYTAAQMDALTRKIHWNVTLDKTKRIQSKVKVYKGKYVIATQDEIFTSGQTPLIPDPILAPSVSLPNVVWCYPNGCVLTTSINAPINPSDLRTSHITIQWDVESDGVLDTMVGVGQKLTTKSPKSFAGLINTMIHISDGIGRKWDYILPVKIWTNPDVTDPTPGPKVNLPPLIYAYMAGSGHIELISTITPPLDILDPMISHVTAVWDVKGDGEVILPITKLATEYTLTKMVVGQSYSSVVKIQDGLGRSWRFPIPISVEANGATLTDSRNGKVYKTVKIGTQTWMAENLNYIPSTGYSWCYADKSENCTTYGRLYDWIAMMALPTPCNRTDCSSQIQIKHQGICPTGWHIPTDTEWKTLEIFVGMTQTDADATEWRGNIGSKLKSSAPLSNNGTDDFGFSVLSVGYKGIIGSFFDFDSTAGFWSASQSGEYGAWNRALHKGKEKMNRSSLSKDFGFSVRCLQDI